MQDTIIKGTGNSRTLASVPNFLTLYPTYEAFAQALINRELPIDLGPINPAGVDTKGTDLTTANLLKDATAALYGKTSAATPDEILAAIRPLITTAQSSADIRAKYEYGTYSGVASVPSKTIYFSFNPRLVILAASDGSGFGICVKGCSVGFNLPYATSSTSNKFDVSFGSQNLTISNKSSTLHQYGFTYYYVAIG